MGFLIVAIIVFAIIQKRRYRRMCAHNKSDKWSRKWDRHMSEGQDQWAKWSRNWEDWGRSEWKEFKHWSSQQDWKRGAKDVENAARDFQRKLSEKIEREAQRLHESRASDQPKFKNDEERKAYERARKRASQEAGFYVHLMWYGIVIGFLFLINMFTSPFTWWWQWPALAWGFGLACHFAGVYGWEVIRQRVFDPAVQREVDREVTKEKEVLATEKQASLDELTASFAHEIRNPIAAAKSLVQQMGEDPTSNENVEYAKVALDELQRVERSVSHLLKYAKEEDYNFENVNLASVLDAALTQMRSQARGEECIGLAQLHRRTDHPWRRRQTPPGFHQRDRQRDRRDGKEHRRTPPRLDDSQLQPRDGYGRDSRQWMRNSGGQAQQDFQSLLHHQAKRHRPRNGNREEGRRLSSR